MIEGLVTMDFLKLEKDIINIYLKNKELINAYENIDEQLKNMHVVCRKFTGAGFITYIEVNDLGLKKIPGGDGVLTLSSLFVSFIGSLGGFINLYSKNGYIDCIDFITLDSGDYFKILDNIEHYEIALK